MRAILALVVVVFCLGCESDGHGHHNPGHSMSGLRESGSDALSVLMDGPPGG